MTTTILNVFFMAKEKKEKAYAFSAYTFSLQLNLPANHQVFAAASPSGSSWRSVAPDPLIFGFGQTGRLSSVGMA